MEVKGETLLDAAMADDDAADFVPCKETLTGGWEGRWKLVALADIRPSSLCIASQNNNLQKRMMVQAQIICRPLYCYPDREGIPLRQSENALIELGKGSKLECEIGMKERSSCVHFLTLYWIYLMKGGRQASWPRSNGEALGLFLDVQTLDSATRQEGAAAARRTPHGEAQEPLTTKRWPLEGYIQAPPQGDSDGGNNLLDECTALATTPSASKHGRLVDVRGDGDPILSPSPTSLRRFTCSVCGNAFRSFDTLLRHCSCSHPDQPPPQKKKKKYVIALFELDNPVHMQIMKDWGWDGYVPLADDAIVGD
ncbi:unnamed protein product, partial [Cyprideis torosa]